MCKLTGVKNPNLLQHAFERILGASTAEGSDAREQANQRNKRAQVKEAVARLAHR